MLELHNVKKTFNKGTINEKKALQGLELMLPAGMTEREAFVQIISNFFRGISTAKGLRMIDDNLKRYELTKYDK